MHTSCTGLTSQRQFKLCVTVYHCLQCKAPQYLIDHCTSVSQIASQRHLQSASRHQLVVPHYRCSMFGRRAFAVSGPTVWNTLPDNLRDSGRSSDSFRCSLKTFLYSSYRTSAYIALVAFVMMHYINSRLTLTVKSI